MRYNKTDNAEKYNTIRVSLSQQGSTGKYRIEKAKEDCADGVFIAYCYGFNNSIRVAHGIAKGQFQYVVSPAFKPEQDTSEYA